MAEVTSAKDSSFETATLCGTPTTLLGACSSPSTFGGDTPMSRIVTVSGGGLAGTVFTPSTSAILLSLAETAICAFAAAAKNGRVERNKRRPPHQHADHESVLPVLRPLTPAARERQTRALGRMLFEWVNARKRLAAARRFKPA